MRKCVLTLALVVTMAAPAASASAQEPILFVHGWSGNSTHWTYMIGRFQADGYPASHLRAFTYNSAQSNTVTAQQVAQEVAALKASTGASRVDIVTHSMGGLSSRYYLKFLGGTAHVDDWVSIGGPNHGTTTAFACSLMTSCREMLPGSAFLTTLNSGDETPGTVNYGTFWSPCDEIINPDESTILSGARNTRTGCIEHLQMLVSDSVYRGVRDFVR